MEQITANHPMSKSADIIRENVEILKSLFPTIVKEGKIDVEELKALLGEEIETTEEYYRFTWAGKSQARQEANKPSTGTLRPVKEESKDWDSTQNIFIEGDNLEVLKLLQKSYGSSQSKVKMIFIDPPYNTGKDFVYKDSYADNLKNYLAISGQSDEEGKKLSTNTESDGRYHSNWLNMMYPRLKLARNILKDDGVIFMSIDDIEVQNLKKLCDEIFGEECFVGIFCWKNKYGAGAKTRGFIEVHEYILCYSKKPIKNIDAKLTEEQIKEYDKKRDEKYNLRGGYVTQPLMTKSMDDRDNLKYSIFFQGDEIKPRKQWVWEKERLLKAIENDEVIIKKKKDGKYSVRNKVYLKDENGVIRKGKPITVLNGPFNQEGTKEVEDLLGEGIFSFPKPKGLLEYLLSFTINGDEENNGTILDFFAGSATTADATMQLNAEDGGKRRFICVQMPEPTPKESEAYKAGYKTISEISRERIRRAGDKIKLTIKEDLYTKQSNRIDIGFRSFKLDSSNINAWDGSVQKFDMNLLSAAENIKPDRTEEDVLYEILLKSGLDLAQPIEEKKIAGKKVFNIGVGALFICLANNLTTDVAEGIGKWKQELEPSTCRVIFKDTGFNDVEKTNSIQILKRYGINEVNTI
jgi:adenine-specific DNA-methyltransferase